MLDLSLLTPIPAYFVVGLSVPLLMTALVAVALATAVALTAGSGLLESGRAVAVTIAMAVLLAAATLVDLAWSALRARRGAGRHPTLFATGEQDAELPGQGPKARHLAALVHAGLPVPDGWVLPTDGDRWRAGALRSLHRTLRSSGHGRFIVRSCFAEEDGHARSFAGLYESHPWDVVEGRRSLERAIEAVLASRSSARAAAYRGDDAPTGPTTVLIQRRIADTAHGFAASADVVTGFRERRLVDITSGAAPWSGHLDVITGEVAGPPAGEEVTALIRRVAALVRRVERRLEVPVEIEWGLQGDTLWLYQARPLTALPAVRTWVQGRGFELPWHPLTPLSRSFLVGGSAPAALLAAPLEAVGIEGPRPDAVTTLNGRLFVDASAADDLVNGSASPSLRGWLRLARSAWRAWRLSAPDEAFPRPPEDAPVVSPSAHLEALEALRTDGLLPLLEAQAHALLVATLCARAQGDAAPAPTPRTAADAARACVERDEQGPISAARRWLWWRADQPAELLATRGIDDPTRLADELTAPGPAPTPSGAQPWRATLRDRALTLREVLSARLQAVNLEARHHIRQLDAHLSERVEGWSPGDVAHLSLTELRDMVTEPLAAQEVVADLPRRRAQWQDQEAARPPAIMRIDDQGLPVAGPEATGRGRGLGGGCATGALLFVDDATTTEMARDRVLFLASPAVGLTPLCLVASAVLMARSGPLSHLAMVIRERGVPCVLLTDRPEGLDEGWRVTVDAERGEVRRAD